MENLLKAKKLRVTPFRIQLLDVFGQSQTAIDLATIESSLGDFDRITLYRSIKAFIKSGVLHEILISGEPKKFALCKELCINEEHNHNHIHFLCNSCNETFCLEPSQMPNISHSSFIIESIEVQAKGICESCSK